MSKLFQTNNKNITDKIIANIVGKTFFYACKKNDLFCDFIKIAFDKKDKALKGIGQSCKTVDVLFDNIFSEGKKYFTSNHLNEGKESKFNLVMCVTNTFLNAYLDTKMGIKPERLNVIGEDIFNTSCYLLYGDEFVQYLQHTQQHNDSFEDFVISEYKRSGLSHVCTLEEFADKFKKQLQGMYKSRNKR